MIIILMGVSGSGKTAIGRRLSKALNIDFFEGDDFHPKSNVDKMSKGIPLSDEDRVPWLESIRRHILNSNKKDLIVACSALKKSYRDVLKQDISNIKFVYLKGDFELIKRRVENRKNHFMKVNLLKSQFEALEEPKEAIGIDASKNLYEIIREIKEVIEGPQTL